MLKNLFKATKLPGIEVNLPIIRANTGSEFMKSIRDYEARTLEIFR